jgi:hypothetical protein
VRLLTDISLLSASLTLDGLLTLAGLFVFVARRGAQNIPNRAAGRYGRVKVARSQIAPDMHVPALDGTRGGDFECGHIAANLFKRAVQTGALRAPAGVQIACYPDLDIAGGGFVLVAYPDGDGSAWGTTTGYYAAEVIGTDDPTDRADRGTVARALEVFARELNTSLAGLEAHVRQRRTGRPARRAWRRQIRCAPVEVPARTPDDRPPLLLAVDDAGECVELILQQATVAPDGDVPGLTSALECLLSLDERDAGSIVEQARRRHG